MKKNILICLEKLDIGGVETAVITQINVFLKRGYNVCVVAKDGIFSDELRNKNVKVINFNYQIGNKFFIDKISFFEKIIKNNKITEIHIHQNPCILYLLPVILKLKIPYIAYVHSIVPGTFQWYMDTYSIYNVAFKLFFENASKIICITESIKKEHEQLFHVKSDLYLVINNCIDFEKFKSKRINNDINKNYLLITRFSKEKTKSIECALELFKKICDKKADCVLKVVGDGELLNEFKNKYEDDNIFFIGSTNDVTSFIDKCDILLGVDRTILEGIAMKKICIVCSYDIQTIFVDSKNIDKLYKVNFSGNKIKSNDALNKIFSLNKEKYDDVTLKNYDFVYKNCNIENKIYDEKIKYNENINSFFILKIINDYQKKVLDEIQNSKILFLDNQKLYKRINELDEIIVEQRKNIENRKRFNLKNFFKK